MRPEREGSKVIISCEDEFLMVKHSYEPRDWGWSFPGGGVKKNEDKKKAAQREVKEELGLTLSDSELHYVGSFKSVAQYKRNTVYVFTASVSKKVAIKKSSEILEAKWVTSENKPPMGTNAKKMLEMYENKYKSRFI